MTTIAAADSTGRAGHRRQEPGQRVCPTWPASDRRGRASTNAGRPRARRRARAPTKTGARRFLSRHCRTIRQSGAGSSGVSAGTGGGSLVRIAFSVSTTESPANARRPVSISYRTAPNANTSDRASACWPRTCSGDMYPAVPSRRPSSVMECRAGAWPCGSPPVCLARPKSRILTRPSRRDEQVLGLDVAVHDAFVVRRRQPGHDLQRDVERLLHRQGTGVEARAKRLPLEQFRDDVGDVTLHADVVHRQDVRMIERADRARLPFEALELFAGDLAAPAAES